MATADEILAGAVEVASEGATQDKVLRIDNELRTISIPSTVKLLGVESDDDVNRIEFEMPRHYGEFDLSTFSVRVNYMNANGDGDIYKVVDLVANEEKMNFSWLVGRTAFMYKGDVQFVVCLKKIAEDFVVEQEFNTTVASLPVLQGLEPDEQLIQRYPDIIEQILKYMETPVSSEEIGKAVEEYLKNNPVGGATINDDEVSAGSAWSSQKVSTQIDEKVSAHNTDPTAHTDVRELISGLTNRLNALADSDDTTLDQLSEIVAYIKSNKSLIDAITTSKVSVSDIVDDLITNSSNKPLSAAQGVKLKALIDAIVPITVDSVLSSTSTNPVQNKVVLNGLNEKENKGAARSVQIGSNSYNPNESGVIDLSSGVATAEEVSSLKSDLAAEQAARASADQALANDKMQLMLLWENASPSSSFVSQSISLDLSPYKYIILEHVRYATDERVICSLCAVGKRTELFCAMVADNYYKFDITSRTIAVQNNGITFDAAYQGNVIDSAAENNQYHIPLKIYGVKG